MKENYLIKIVVVVPEFQGKYMIAKKSRKTGKPRMWTVNGQSIYNATMNFMVRAKMTRYFHNYLSKYIKEQINSVQINHIRDNVGPGKPHKLAISLDVYEIRRNKIPDIGNLWIWIKWFEDALQHCGIIPDDNPDYIIESGRKRYHWVETDEKRKLVFIITIV